MKQTILLATVLASSACVVSIDDWMEEGNYVHFESADPSGDETLLDASVDLSVGELTIQAGNPAELYQMDVRYNENAFKPELDLSREGSIARLRFELKGGQGKLARKIGQNRLDLRLNPDTPLHLSAKTGVTGTEIDLSGMTVEAFDLEADVGETSISILSANRTSCGDVKIKNGVGSLKFTGLGNLNFQRFDFENGVGAAVLDFSGNWDKEGRVHIQVGVGGVEVLLPRDLGAELRVSKSFLSGIDVTGFHKQGDVYLSDNLDQVEKKIRIDVEAGIGGIEISWI
jgi:hypothetical protein